MAHSFVARQRSAILQMTKFYMLLTILFDNVFHLMLMCCSLKIQTLAD